MLKFGVCVAVRWLSPASADGEGCWLTPDESGERSVFSSKGKGIPSLPACLQGSPLFPLSRLLDGLQRIPDRGGFCRLIPTACGALPSCPWHSRAQAHTQRAPGRAKVGLESPPAPGAASAKHNRPLGKLTHRKRPGLMSKLVNFPDDRAEEAEAAHRSPWTPPAHECEPAAATSLSWEGHGPSGTPQTLPKPGGCSLNLLCIL